MYALFTFICEKLESGFNLGGNRLCMTTNMVAASKMYFVDFFIFSERQKTLAASWGDL